MKIKRKTVVYMKTHKKNITYVAVMPTWSLFKSKKIGCFIANKYYDISVVAIFAEAIYGKFE